MLTEILRLTDEAGDAAADHDGSLCALPSSDPAIMIPGIAEDGSLFPIEKIAAHREAIHHLALSVFIFDGDMLLIQRRADEKYHCGGLWANTCCTHPHFGEDIENAAHRRLKEELGVTCEISERLIVEYSADVGGGLWERERVHMFRAEVEKDALAFDLNPEEVAEVRWVSAKTLRAEMQSTPELFTPWFRIYLNRFPELDF